MVVVFVVVVVGGEDVKSKKVVETCFRDMLLRTSLRHSVRDVVVGWWKKGGGRGGNEGAL